MVKPNFPPIINSFSNLSTVAQWNSSIREAMSQGFSDKALLLFRQMKQNGVQPNHLTLPFIAKACGKLSDLQCSQMIHADVVKSPYHSDIYVQTALVDAYMKCKKLDYAHNLFDHMPQRDVASWNALLVGFAQIGLPDEVSIVFNQMSLDGVRPDSITIIGLTQSISDTKDVDLVKAIHSFGIRIGIEADVSVANTWISAYCKCGDLKSAETVFDEIDRSSITAVSWNSMISGCAHLVESTKAIGFYRMMLYHEFKPDTSTILGLLTSCVQPDSCYQGKTIHSQVIQLGFDSDIPVLNTLISMYSRCGEIDSARQVFDKMTDRTSVSWNAMIGGYTEKGDLDKALKMFHTMKQTGENPDLVTLLCLISGCSQTGNLKLGKLINNFAISNGFLNNVMIRNALIDMYAKCGSMREAQELFITMNETTVVSWTTLISGFALNGEFRQALNHFFRMIESGLKPNEVTFLSVLQACTHGGYLDEGFQCFNLMTKVYKINPGIDHYSCMVDLLGRKGKIEEGLCFIQNVGVKPDSGIWGALLFACRVHRNVEIGEYVSSRLLEVEAMAAAPYVGMANVYASVGRWVGVSGVRKMMRCNKVLKFPGESLVHVNGRSCRFRAGDREGVLMYGVLNGLDLQLKAELDSCQYEDDVEAVSNC